MSIYCSLYINERLALLNIIQEIDTLELRDSQIVEVFLPGKDYFGISSKINILNATRDFLLKTKRFDEKNFKVKINEAMTYYIFIFQVKYSFSRH